MTYSVNILMKIGKGLKGKYEGGEKLGEVGCFFGNFTEGPTPPIRGLGSS